MVAFLTATQGQGRPVPLGKGCALPSFPPSPSPRCYECVLFERLRFRKRIGLVLCDSSTFRIAVSREGGHWVTVRVGVRAGPAGMGLRLRLRQCPGGPDHLVGGGGRGRLAWAVRLHDF